MASLQFNRPRLAMGNAYVWTLDVPNEDPPEGMGWVVRTGIRRNLSHRSHRGLCLRPAGGRTVSKVQSKNAILFDVVNDAGPLRDAAGRHGSARRPRRNRGLVAGADKEKLDGIATNSELRDRTTHTGERVDTAPNHWAGRCAGRKGNSGAGYQGGHGGAARGGGICPG